MSAVLFFGTFDPLHAGHRQAFGQARAQGDRLVVVVARDSAVLEQKKRAAHQDENERLARVATQTVVDEAILGILLQLHIIFSKLFHVMFLRLDMTKIFLKRTLVLFLRRKVKAMFG